MATEIREEPSRWRSPRWPRTPKVAASGCSTACPKLGWKGLADEDKTCQFLHSSALQATGPGKLPATGVLILHLPSSALPAPVLCPTHLCFPGMQVSALPFRVLLSSSAAWWPKWLPSFRGPSFSRCFYHRLTASRGDLWLPDTSTASCSTPSFSVAHGSCSAAPPVWLLQPVS